MAKMLAGKAEYFVWHYGISEITWDTVATVKEKKTMDVNQKELRLLVIPSNQVDDSLSVISIILIKYG